MQQQSLAQTKSPYFAFEAVHFKPKSAQAGQSANRLVRVKQRYAIWLLMPALKAVLLKQLHASETIKNCTLKKLKIVRSNFK